MVVVYIDEWERKIIDNYLKMALGVPFSFLLAAVSDELGRDIGGKELVKVLNKVILGEDLTDTEYEIYLAFKRVIRP